MRTKKSIGKTAKGTLAKGKVKAMPRKVARRIMARCARGEKKIVVISKNGKPSSVFGFDDYLKMQELPGQVKPWTGRKTPPRPSDELPRIDAGITGPLDRKDFYE